MKTGLGLLVAGGGALALRHVDFRLVGAQMVGLPRSTLLLALTVSLAQVVALATRLWAVFPEKSRPGWARVARAFGFGQLANACLPGRAGDVLKVVAIAKDDDADAASGEPASQAARPSLASPPPPATSTADATGVMLADKALDMVTLGALVVAFAPALLVGLVAGAMHMAWVGAIAAALAAVGVLALRRWWPGVFRKVVHGATATYRALRGLLTPRRLATGLVLGCAAWLAEAGSMMLLSSPMGVHLSLAQAMVGLLVLNVGIAVPVSVANVGAYEAATVVGLAPFGVAPAQALALGALHHAVQLATVAVFALAFWLRDRMARRRAGRPARARITLLPAARRAEAICEIGAP